MYIESLLAAAGEVLGGRMHGFYLAGSLALGEFDLRRSDIDIAVVVTAELADPVKVQLAHALSHSVIACPARGLELVVYTADAAASGTSAPAFEMELNDGPSMPYRFTADPLSRPADDGTFWYGIDRDILHQAGSALTGPSASSTFLGPAPRELRQLLLAAMDWQMSRPAPSSADAVLGACRTHIRISSGLWRGKREAGTLTAKALPEWAPVIARALESRERGGGEVVGANEFLSAVYAAVAERSVRST
jgi:hypothetical protein